MLSANAPITRMNMKTKCCVIAALLFGLVGCSSMKSTAQSSDLVTETRSIHRNFEAAFNAGDFKAVAALYSTDAKTVLYPPDLMAAHGRTEIENGLVALGKKMPGAKLTLTEENFRVVADSVTTWGLWELIVPQSEGHITKMEGRYSALLVKENGKLVLLVDHASAPLPAEPAAKPKPKQAVAKRSKHKKSH